MRSIAERLEPGRADSLSPGGIDRVLARARRPLDRAYERRAAALSSAAALADDVASRPAGRSGGRDPRVLIVSLRGWSAHLAYETTIAHALRLRGARVALLSCGGGMPACELGRARVAHPRPCDRCGWLSDRALGSAGLRRYRLADLMPWGGDARAAPLLLDRDAATEISLAWLLKASQTERVAGAGEVAADFAAAAAGVAHAAETVLSDFEPDVVFLLNGLFAAERTIRACSLARGLRAPTYEIAPRAGALVFSQRTPAPDYDVDRLWAAVGGRPLSDEQRARTLALLADRARGVGAHESYFDRVVEEPAELRRVLGLADRDRVVSLFTNVTWDSATIGHDIGFRSMFDWVAQAIARSRDRDLVLVVRIHPAEARWGTREEVQDVVASRLGSLPGNVRFVSARERLSSYALIDLSDVVLAYTTTTGLEAATRGRRVAVCGQTHYRARGFTIDVGGPEQLGAVIAQTAGPASPTEVELAVRYAHMFFFRAMIPFPLVRMEGGRVKSAPRRASEIEPGADRHLDWICERILDGEDFGLPDELLALLSAAPAAPVST